MAAYRRSVIQLDRRARTGALGGAVSMSAALGIAFLASISGLPFPPAALGQAVIEVMPGWIAIPLIELLHFWAQRLLVAGVLLAFLIAGAVSGLLAAHEGGMRRAVIAGALPWTAAAAFGPAFAGSSVDLRTLAIGAAIGALAFFAALSFLLGSIESVRGSAVASASRRRALLGAMAAAAVVGVGALAFSAASAAGRRTAQGVRAAARRLRLAAAIPEPDPAFETIDRLTPRITANPDHYTVDTALVDPRVDVRSWSLEIDGAVAEPYSLNYEELRDLEAVEQPHTLECISNEIGGDLISTAVWTGVPLPDLLARARPLPGAVDVVLESVDGYTDSITLPKALEPRTLVAYLMNGEIVSEEHGFPARALVPDIYGMKNVKWLRRIHLATHDYLGYWMDRGWSDVALVQTRSRIDTPRGTVRWTDGEIAVAGIANAGARGVGRVEVSADGGRTWVEATLEPPVSDLTWRRWRLAWRPAGPGRYRLLVRATDGAGARQGSEPRQPFPSGAGGWHAVEVTVQQG